jgi:Kef-type K+ transport system membrane component KefB
MVDLIVLACVVFAFGIVSRRLEGTVLTAPIVFVLAGVVLGPAGLVHDQATFCGTVRCL